MFLGAPFHFFFYAIMRGYLREVAQKLISGLLPKSAPSAEATTVKTRRSPARAILIGGGAAVLVGGGIAAAVLLGKDEAVDETPTPNARIELP